MKAGYQQQKQKVSKLMETEQLTKDEKKGGGVNTKSKKVIKYFLILNKNEYTI